MAKRKSDFKEKSKKLGKKKLKPTNFTNIEFKAKSVYVPSQNLRAEKSDFATSRNLSADDLLTQLRHYNFQVKKEALVGLKELVETFGEVAISRSLQQLISECGSAMLDPNPPVLNALLAFVSAAFPLIPQDKFRPFVGVFIAYTCTALTHINSDIRIKAVDITQVLLNNFPLLLSQPMISQKLLPVLVNLLSLTRSSTTTATRINFAPILKLLNSYIQSILCFNRIAIPIASLQPHSHTHVHDHFQRRRITKLLDNSNNSSDDANENSEAFVESDSTSDVALFARKNEVSWGLDSARAASILLPQMATVDTQRSQQISKLSTAVLLDPYSTPSTTSAAAATLKSQATTTTTTTTTPKAAQTKKQREAAEATESESDTSMFRLETENDIFAFISKIMKRLVEIWLESLPVTNEPQPSYKTHSLVFVCGVLYNLLYAYDHLKPASGRTRIQALFKDNFKYITKHYPLSFVAATQTEQDDLVKANIAVTGLLSFFVGTSEKLKTWEVRLAEQVCAFIKVKNICSVEDFGKLLGVIHRIHRFMPTELQNELWKAFTLSIDSNKAASDRKKLCIELLSTLLLHRDSTKQRDGNSRIDPVKHAELLKKHKLTSTAAATAAAAKTGLAAKYPLPILRQWFKALPSTLTEIGAENLPLTKKILDMLHQFARNRAQYSEFVDQLQSDIIPFYYSLTNDEFGPFVSLPRELQDEAIQLVFHFFHSTAGVHSNGNNANKRSSLHIQHLLRALAKCCSHDNVHSASIVHIVELLSHKHSEIEFQALISFLLTVCVSDERRINLALSASGSNSSNKESFAVLYKRNGYLFPVLESVKSAIRALGTNQKTTPFDYAASLRLFSVFLTRALTAVKSSFTQTSTAVESANRAAGLHMLFCFVSIILSRTQQQLITEAASVSSNERVISVLNDQQLLASDKLPLALYYLLLREVPSNTSNETPITANVEQWELLQKRRRDETLALVEMAFSVVGEPLITAFFDSVLLTNEKQSEHATLEIVYMLLSRSNHSATLSAALLPNKSFFTSKLLPTLKAKSGSISRLLTEEIQTQATLLFAGTS